MRCPSCGSVIRDGQRCCPYCGAPSASRETYGRVPPRRRERPPVSGAARACSGLLAALLVVVLLLSGAVGIGRSLLSRAHLEDIVLDFDVNEVCLSYDGTEYPLPAYIQRQIAAQVETDLTERDVENILNDVGVREGVADLAADVAAYLTDRQALEAFGADDVVGLVRKNEALIYEQTGTRLTEAEYAQIRQAVDENVDFSAVRELRLTDVMGFDPALLQTVLSKLTYGIGLFLCANLLVLLLIANRRDLRGVLAPLAAALLIPGVLWLLTAAVGLALPRVLSGQWTALLRPILGEAAKLCALHGCVLLLLGLGLTLWNNLAKRRRYSY